MDDEQANMLLSKKAIGRIFFPSLEMLKEADVQMNLPKTQGLFGNVVLVMLFVFVRGPQFDSLQPL